MILESYKKMLSNIQKYKGHTREDLYFEYVKQRLEKSYKSYSEEIEQGIKYLERRDELNVLKRLNRLK